MCTEIIDHLKRRLFYAANRRHTPLPTITNSSRSYGSVTECPMTGLSLSVQTYFKNNSPGRRLLNEHSHNDFSIKLAEQSSRSNAFFLVNQDHVHNGGRNRC